MNHTHLSMSRRSFTKGMVAGFGAPAIVPAFCWGNDSKALPSNRITLGLIGLGSMGMRHVKGFLQEADCRIVAVCDVDTERRRDGAAEINRHYGDKGCAQYADFRTLCARKDIDALCIAAPDHWHCILSMTGIRSGKDIYGEKPLTRTVDEGKALVKAVKRYECVWQTGSWQRSTPHFRFGCELVRNQRIGKLQRVEVGIGWGFNPGGGKPVVDHIEAQALMPVPDELDYQMWLGPAPWAAYTEKRCHWNFRWIMDYAGGQVTDWGAHHIDIAHWGMGCDDTGPVEVEGKGLFPEDGLWDAAYDYDFACRYDNGVTMYVGSTNHYAQGVRFIGSAGWIHITRSGLKASSRHLLKEKIGPNEIHLAKPAGVHRQGHRRDFLDCIKSRARTVTPVEIGHRSATVAHLGNIAMMHARRIRWDPTAEQIIGDLSAERRLGRATRSPWHI